MRVQVQLVGLLVALGVSLASIRRASAIIKVETPKELEQLFKFGADPASRGDKLDLFDLFLEDILPTWLGQAPNNQNGTLDQYKRYNLLDESNDDAFGLTAQQLITRSGFRYELYDAVAEDGYVTQITHVINPLADQDKLRRPPVLIEHGGQIDITAYMIASSIQHFPEKWPRAARDGPVRSSNRSLAFYLANEGFDVWLAETRGASDTNKGHVTTRLVKNKLEGTSDERNQTLGEQFKKIAQQWDYWAFTQDDIVAYEYKSHIDTVREMSGSDKLHVITYSLSTPTSLAFFSQRPEYAEKVVGFVSVAPIVSGQGLNLPVKLVFENFCALLPDELGTLLFTHTLFTQPFRELLRLIASNKYIRYTILKAVVTLLLGPSPKWRTLIDLNVIGHLLRQASFREIKQMCQQMRSNKLQKYDYGPIRNQLVYGSPEPPVYDLSHLHLKNWIIVSAENDALSTPGVVRHLMKIANPKPVAHINIPNFNHADLFAGWENDVYVNEPIMKYLEEASILERQQASKARGLDLGSFFSDLLPTKVIENKINSTASEHPLTLPTIYLDAVQKAVNEFFGSLSKDFGQLLVNKFTGTPTAAAGSASGVGKDATKALVRGTPNAVKAAKATATAVAATSALTGALVNSKEGTDSKQQPQNPLTEIPLLGDLGAIGGGLGSLGDFLGGAAKSSAASQLAKLGPSVSDATKAVRDVASIVEGVDHLIHPEHKNGGGGGGGGGATNGGASKSNKLPKLGPSVSDTTKVIGEVTHIVEGIDHLIHPDNEDGASNKSPGNLFAALTG